MSSLRSERSNEPARPGSAMVSVKEIAGVKRDFRGHLTVRLKQRKETLPVGENYVHLFKQM